MGDEVIINASGLQEFNVNWGHEKVHTYPSSSHEHSTGPESDLSGHFTGRNRFSGSFSGKFENLLTGGNFDWYGNYNKGNEINTARARAMRANFQWTRGHISAKTANKDLLKIHLHTFRHFFATKLYLQTRGIRFVQKKMGHRSITSTTIYENSEPNQEVEQYTIKAVSSKSEAIKLGELGYEPFDTIDGVKLYRKRVIDVV